MNAALARRVLAPMPLRDRQRLRARAAFLKHSMRCRFGHARYALRCERARRGAATRNGRAA